VPVTLSTDDRTVSGLTLVREYGRAVATLGLTLQELWRIDRHGLEVAFLHDDEPLRAQLLAEFDAFAATEPALSS
jgi:adenosine deaminase